MIIHARGQLDQYPSEGAGPGRQEVKGEEIATAVKRFHLAADQPEEPHVPQDVQNAGMQECGRPELPDPAVLKNSLGRRLEPVCQQERVATQDALLQQEGHAVDDDQGLAPRRDTAEPARTTRLTTIIFAVINSHDGSAPAGGAPRWLLLAQPILGI